MSIKSVVNVGHKMVIVTLVGLSLAGGVDILLVNFFINLCFIIYRWICRMRIRLQGYKTTNISNCHCELRSKYSYKY